MTAPATPQWAVYVGNRYSGTVYAWNEAEALRLANAGVGTTTAIVTVGRIPF